MKRARRIAASQMRVGDVFVLNSVHRVTRLTDLGDMDTVVIAGDDAGDTWIHDTEGAHYLVVARADEK